MWTERDQIQAYQFLRRRMVSALAAGDANDAVSPSRRLMLGTTAGAILVLLAAAAFSVIGLIKPTSSVNWRQPNQVILEQGSGALFVLGGDGLLHPVINQASALLLAGTDKTITAPASALDTAPRGAALGIPGAPNSVPSAADLLKPTPLTCSSVSASQPAAPKSALLLLGPGQAGSALAGMRALGTGGLLVQPPGGGPSLIADGYRYALPDRADVVALGYQNVTALPVSPNWLGSLPAGRDLDLVAVPGAGRAGPAVGGAATRVGQVFATSSALGGAANYYLVRADGLESITQTQAVLVLADTDDAAAYPGTTPKVLQTSVAGVASAPQHPASDDAAGYPAQVPTPAAVSGAAVVVCAAGNGSSPASVATAAALPLPAGARAMSAGTASGNGVADQVYVPPGSGALVTAQAAPGAHAAAVYLVTDEGLKFELVSTDARRALGYGSVKPVALAPALLGLLPAGPALNPAAARNAVSDGGSR